MNDLIQLADLRSKYVEAFGEIHDLHGWFEGLLIDEVVTLLTELMNISDESDTATPITNARQTLMESKVRVEKARRDEEISHRQLALELNYTKSND